MRNKIKTLSSDVSLSNVLDALVDELLDVADDEILETVEELKMNLAVKESAAFAGLLYPAHPKVGDFFDVDSQPLLPFSGKKICRRTH